MKRNLFFATLFFLVCAPVYGDFSIGAEYSLVSRELDFGTLDLDSESADSLGVYLGFDWKSSIFYLKYYSEEAEFEEISDSYEKDQALLEWHWNKEGAKKRNSGNTSFGISHTSYKLGPAINTDFGGVSMGGGFTRFLKGPLFFNLRGKLHLYFSLDDEDLFTVSGDSADTTSFLGYEVQTALGFQFGRRAAWALQVGYRFHDSNFEGRFIDDTSQQAFVNMRFFVASKKD